MAHTSSTATELYCPRCEARYSLETIINLCRCGTPLLVDYDYDTAAEDLDRRLLLAREPSMWRYRELLPVQDDASIVTLAEGGTPLLKSAGLETELGLSNLYFKDETVNPTGSFKARGLAMAVSRAKELGLHKLIIPTAGNAGSALAAYAARAGIDCRVIMPRDVPVAFQADCRAHGAEIELVDGTIKNCGARVGELVATEDWFSVATLKEPYRIEGKKTMGYEIAEQFGYDLPEVIIYPTGGGTGLIGMWKAFAEMDKMGWLSGAKPKMVSVQSAGCAPMVRAFENGDETAEEWENPSTLAAGLRVPGAVGDFLILKAVRESGGTAIAVSEDDLMNDTIELAAKEGIFSAPEGGATLSALKKLLANGFVEPDDRVVLFITGTGYKYLDVLAEWTS
ncbi:MAG: threonine synthase [candidate division Zixibacteria bacterium]|nr:threonine synthase [candidate division Zixibacteria bacterium]